MPRPSRPSTRGSARAGRQPRTSAARVERATRTGGSPARRSPTSYGIGRPTTRLGGGHDLPDREAVAVAEVERDRPVGARIARRGRFQREQVRVGQVGDVDVVADAGPVGRRVVVAEDRRRPAGLDGLEDGRDQVRLGVVVLAGPLGRPGDVEVAQAHAAQAVGPAIPVERSFERPLRLAVRVDRAERRVLGDRRSRRGCRRPRPTTRTRAGRCRCRGGPRAGPRRRRRCRGSSATGRGSTHRPATARRNGGRPRSARPRAGGRARPGRRRCRHGASPRPGPPRDGPW